MRVLYRDASDGSLSVEKVTGTTYYPEEEILQFSGENTDFGIRADKAAAEKIVRSLYLEGKVDVSGYQACEVEVDFDEDDEDDEDDDEISELIDQMFEDTDAEEYRLPHRIAFPTRRKD